MESQKFKWIYSDLQEFLLKKDSCVLATVTSTMGSTPQKQGSSALFDRKNILAGTLGGGITEQAVGNLASKAIETKKSGYFRFDLNHDITEIDAAICGGSMRVFIDAQPEKTLSVFETLNQSFSNRIPGVLVTECLCNTSDNSDNPDISDITRHWLTRTNKEIISEGIDIEVFDAAVEMLEKQEYSDFKELKFTKGNKEKIAFLEMVVPLPQLVIAGAGHVGKALTHLGKLLNFEVIVWDGRKEFANSIHLPDADKILTGSLNESLGKFKPKKDSYIVIVTHGHKNDAEVLRLFIGSDANYIGMIGSRKKIAQVRESFLNNGWATKEQWNRVHSPVGLDIGAKSVQEIAISIVAQLVQVRNQNRKS